MERSPMDGARLIRVFEHGRAGDGRQQTLIAQGHFGLERRRPSLEGTFANGHAVPSANRQVSALVSNSHVKQSRRLRRRMTLRERVPNCSVQDK